MKTQEQVSVDGTVPISTWDDLTARQAAWADLREKAAAIAARDGKTLTGTPEMRLFTYVRVTESADGEPWEVECTRGEAELVRLRLSCWASKE